MTEKPRHRDAIARGLVTSLCKLLGAKAELVTWVKSTGESGQTITITTEDK